VDLEEPAMLRSLEAAWRRVQDYPGLIVVPSKDPPPPAWSIEGRHTMPLPIDMPGFGERVWLLEVMLGDAPGVPDQEDITTLANRYRMNRLQLQQSVAFARDRAWARGDGGVDAPLSFEDLVSGARAQFSRDIGALAKRHTPRFGFDELVLPEKEKAHLTELIAFVERRGTVYEDWGFRQKFSRGTGAKALFFGRSGTGKTMAAEVIAKHLSLDLFKVDLSSIVSKWVGETEKNLATVFDRAEEAQAVLLFDEADALFGQRTSVGSAVDRYANLETNYLLQRIEEYDGIAILSSNFKQNIDEAFTRRFHFILEFPFPDRASREEIWSRAVPHEAPLADNVDFEFLADRFKFTGGNIKNTILRAAFLAASERSPEIRMRHLVRAVFREYQNLERDPSRREFGDWWGDVKDLMVDDKGRRRRDEPK
jgi:AAA+ superfamily predicted ATPase